MVADWDPQFLKAKVKSAKLNLLFIYTDEQAVNTLAAYRNTIIQMPNLNRLAEESIIFDQVYVTQPVCTPSRSSLLTGLYPHANGCTENNIPLHPETACLPEMITRGQYVSGHFGKWHLGDELFAQHGFTEWVSIEDCYNSFFSEGKDCNAASSYHDFLIAKGFIPKNGTRFGRSETARFPEEFGKPAFLAQKASNFIRTNQYRPFILYVNFLEPHMPFFGPRDAQYDPANMPLPANFNNKPSKQQPLKTRLLQELYFRLGFAKAPLRTETDWQRMIANYWGLCSLIDTHIGSILSTLESCGLRDRTIVIFTSDHGDMMGSHRLLAKCVMFQEAIRVPLLIRLPGQRVAKRLTGPVSQIDIVPTLLDLLGQPAPDHLQGRSLCNLMKSSHPVASENVFIEWNGGDGLDMAAGGQTPLWMQSFAPSDEIWKSVRDPVRTIITPGGWKFNYSPLGEHELYNLAQDPYETRNLIVDPKHRNTVHDLADAIYKWQDLTGDTITFPRL